MKRGKGKKSNITVANVKSILKTSTKNVEPDFPYEPKLTRSKTKELLQSQPTVVWPITPIKKVPESEHLVFFNQELPEESDDEEYKPNLDDLQDQSEDESGRHSVVSTLSQTSALDNSGLSQYIENFDSNLLDVDARNNIDIFKIPEENIGQRTRSKLCLSHTPLEAIEEAFIPPDITTDMYDFQCDNEDWENFLKQYMQPLSNNTNDLEDDDDEADPEYNALAEEEEVDKEELRRDKAVKIPRKELKNLINELFECPYELSCDEEEENRVRSEISCQVHLEVAAKEKENQKEKGEENEKEGACEKTLMDEEEEERLLEKRESSEPVTAKQKLLLEQQLRQHVQLTTQHFLLTCQHPIYNNSAQECKTYIATLVELGKTNPKSSLNVYNLNPAFTLMEGWEHFLLGKHGNEVIEHMKKEVSASQKAKRENKCYQIKLHTHLMQLISKSKVFLYPGLLPSQGFRCDTPFRPEFVNSEDALIALGLEQFSHYIKKNLKGIERKFIEKKAIDMTCEYLVPAKKAFQVVRRIRNAKELDGNPLQHYRETEKAPKTTHYIIPFNDYLKKPPCEQSETLLPVNFKKFLYPEKMEEDKENENSSNK